MTEMNDAQRRIWADDAPMTVVDPATIKDGGVRFSEEAIKVLRDQGVEAYERYVAEHGATG